MIFGIKEKSIQCIVVYFYKYSCAAYDCVCAAGTHLMGMLGKHVFVSWVDASGQIGSGHNSA